MLSLLHSKGSVSRERLCESSSISSRGTRRAICAGNLPLNGATFVIFCSGWWQYCVCVGSLFLTLHTGQSIPFIINVCWSPRESQPCANGSPFTGIDATFPNGYRDGSSVKLFGILEQGFVKCTVKRWFGSHKCRLCQPFTVSTRWIRCSGAYSGQTYNRFLRPPTRYAPARPCLVSISFENSTWSFDKPSDFWSDFFWVKSRRLTAK
jgi:hypothetical protein